MSNDTKPINARLFGKKATGGKVELLIEHVLADATATSAVSPHPSPAMIVGS